MRCPLSVFGQGVFFSLDEPNLTRILTVFKENLVRYKGKIAALIV